MNEENLFERLFITILVVFGINVVFSMGLLSYIFWAWGVYLFLIAICESQEVNSECVDCKANECVNSRESKECFVDDGGFCKNFSSSTPRVVRDLILTSVGMLVMGIIVHYSYQLIFATV